MPALIYGLTSAKHLLEKLRREHARLNEEVTSDNFFNFVVTGYHLVEWVKKDPTVSQAAKNDLPSVRAASCIATCRDLTNASKHFALNANYQNQVANDAKSERGFGVGRFGKGGYGVGEEYICVELRDGSTIDALRLAKEVITEWESFFVRHAI
jgi:hypothetical protein